MPAPPSGASAATTCSVPPEAWTSSRARRTARVPLSLSVAPTTTCSNTGVPPCPACTSRSVRPTGGRRRASGRSSLSVSLVRGGRTSRPRRPEPAARAPRWPGPPGSAGSGPAGAGPERARDSPSTTTSAPNPSAARATSSASAWLRAPTVGPLTAQAVTVAPVAGGVAQAPGPLPGLGLGDRHGGHGAAELAGQVVGVAGRRRGPRCSRPPPAAPGGIPPRRSPSLPSSLSFLVSFIARPPSPGRSPASPALGAASPAGPSPEPANLVEGRLRRPRLPEGYTKVNEMEALDERKVISK